jgi:hypothetical protein
MTSNNNNTRKVSEEFVIQVFDKIRDVNEELSADVKELRNAIIGLGEAYNKRYEGQPRPVELHQLLDSWGKTFEIRHKASKEKLEFLEKIISGTHTKLKDHCDHAEAGIDDIEDAIEKDDNKLDKILKRVNTMIIVVCVAFSIITLSYLFVRSTVDVIVDKKIEKIERQYQTEIQEQLEEIKRALEKHTKETEK